MFLSTVHSACGPDSGDIATDHRGLVGVTRTTTEVNVQYPEVTLAQQPELTLPVYQKPPLMLRQPIDGQIFLSPPPPESDEAVDDFFDGLGGAMDKLGKYWGYVKTVQSIVEFIQGMNSPDPLEAATAQIIEAIANETDRTLVSDVTALVNRARDLMFDPHADPSHWNGFFDLSQITLARMADVIVLEAPSRAARLSTAYNLLVLVMASAYRTYGYSDDYVGLYLFARAEQVNTALLGPYIEAGYQEDVTIQTFNAQTGQWEDTPATATFNPLPIYREDAGKLLAHYLDQWEDCDADWGSGCIGADRWQIIRARPNSTYYPYRQHFNAIWVSNEVIRLFRMGAYQQTLRYNLAQRGGYTPLQTCYTWCYSAQCNVDQVASCIGMDPTWQIEPLIGNTFALRLIGMGDDALCLADWSRYDVTPKGLRQPLLAACNATDVRQQWVADVLDAGRSNAFLMTSVPSFTCDDHRIWHKIVSTDAVPSYIAVGTFSLPPLSAQWMFQDATKTAFSTFTSEESSPVQCPDGTLMSAFACQGRYCDNVAIGCQRETVYRTGAWSTSYFSEESPGQQTCGAGFVIGIDCAGRYCDNLSLQCATLSGRAATDCRWTSEWLSEETGRKFFDADYFLNGIRCQGSYCDNKQFRVCRY
jgi:hypothetical protein